MADPTDEDPYAVSSDSEDEQKGPPPKINIEGRATADLQQIKESLTSDKGATRDERTLGEIEELKRSKADEFKEMKREFEKGTVQNTADASEGKVPSKEVEKPTGLDKATLSAFKDKFEHMDDTLGQNLEERLRSMEKSGPEGVGKENLANVKEMFESGQAGAKDSTEGKEALDIQRSEADKKRVLATFMRGEKEAEEEKNCCVCATLVYPVEKVIACKKLYHTNCFKCAKCGKKLSPTTFNSHQGSLYCRPHMLEILHPERVGSAVEAEDEGEGTIYVEDDEEFAVTSRPKQLASDVVRGAGGSDIGSELSQLKNSLKDKKENWQASVNEANLGAVKKESATAEIEAGKVKASMDKFISAPDGEVLDDEEKRMQLEAIKGQVSEVKNKWKTGEIEKAEVHEGGSTQEELEELKKGLKVRERFQPTEGDGVTKSYDPNLELEHSGAAQARRSFLEGSAFQTAPAEKSAASELHDLKFTELGSVKDRFEKGMAGEEDEGKEKPVVDLDVQLKSLKETFEKGEAEMSPEERAERKKKEIEDEFLHYKMVRKMQKKRQEAEEGDTTNGGSGGNRFESGEASKAFKEGIPDVDIKLAGKAREKFMTIDQQAGQQQPGTAGDKTPSKWDKNSTATPEVVNRRSLGDDSSEEDDEGALDVKTMMAKFKSLGENAASPASRLERKLEDLEGFATQARNLREKFEVSLTSDGEQNEEKKRQLEEEWQRLREERDRAKQELEAEFEAEKEKASSAAYKEEIQVAADHASKMTAKWEKIQQKEAKKAQKSQMPSAK